MTSCEKPCPHHPLEVCSQFRGHETAPISGYPHVHRLSNETSHLFDDTGRVWGWMDEKHGWQISAAQFEEMLDPSFDPNEPPNLDAMIDAQAEREHYGH